MMKRIIILLIIITILSACAEKRPSKYIYYSRENILIDAESMIEYLNDADIVFFGEIHDDSLTHVLQLHIYRQLLARNPYALGLEMFERDVQHIIDMYIVDSIPETDFLGESRPWNNFGDYRPLVKMAKNTGNPVIALNVPRYIASAVASGGLDVLDTFPAEYYTVFEDYSNEYKDAFSSTMKQMGSNAPMNKMINMDNVFFAQVLKDATMAQSLMDFIDARDMSVYVLCGAFHSNFHMGIIEQLQILGYKGNIVNIAVMDSICNIDSSIADFILIKELYE